MQTSCLLYIYRYSRKCKHVPNSHKLIYYVDSKLLAVTGFTEANYLKILLIVKNLHAKQIHANEAMAYSEYMLNEHFQMFEMSSFYRQQSKRTKRFVNVKINLSFSSKTSVYCYKIFSSTCRWFYLVVLLITIYFLTDLNLLDLLHIQYRKF